MTTPAIAADNLRVWDRPVPTDFLARLAQVFPRTPGLPWLLPVWEHGDPWQPIERWVIYIMTPLSLLTDAEMASIGMELRGPDPRSTGHYCAAGKCGCAIKANRWKGGAAVLIDQMTWRLFREHKHYARRLWIVQGDNGGHPRSYDPIEQQIAQARGLPEDPPTIGDLPFAPLDERVIRQLVARDRLRSAKGTLHNTLLSPQGMRAADEARARAAAEQVFAWFDDHMTEGAEQLAWAMQKDYGNVVTGRHGEHVPVQDRDCVREEFVHSVAVMVPDSD